MQSNTGLGQVMIGVLHSLVTDLNLAPLGSHWTPQSPDCSAENRLHLSLKKDSYFCSTSAENCCPTTLQKSICVS